MAEVLAVVPARANSKRVRGKNYRLIAGTPLISWTLREAAKSELINRIVVSTDSPLIARTALREGAEVPFLRSSELSGDATPTLPVILDVIERLAPYRPDYIVLLQVTSPLRNRQDIDDSIHLLLDSPWADSVVSCQEIPHQFQPGKIFTIGDAELVNFLTTSVSYPHRSLYSRNGPAVLVSKIETLEAGSLYGTKTLAFRMPAERSIDIDTELDFFMAEKMLEEKIRRQKD